jgi:hypothetical protein
MPVLWDRFTKKHLRCILRVQVVIQDAKIGVGFLSAMELVALKELDSAFSFREPFLYLVWFMSEKARNLSRTGTWDRWGRTVDDKLSHKHWWEKREGWGTRRAGWGSSGIPFSAFWLRSSVVSVLISLISDTRLIEPHDINLIFQRVQVHPAACCPDLRASPWYCTTSLAGAAPTPSLRDPIQNLNCKCAVNLVRSSQFNVTMYAIDANLVKCLGNV